MVLRYLLGFVFLLFTVQSAAQLSADFSSDAASGCAPIRIIFKDQSTGNPDRWKWDLGNGTISTSKDPSTTYFNPGNYTIKLTVYRGSDSAVAVKQNFVRVFAIPTVNFSGSPLLGCAPLPVNFKDASVANSGSLTSWRWDFGDGSLSTAQNPTHIYKNQGKYKLTLTVRNSDGCSNSASKTEYITVLDSAKARFTHSFTPSCYLPLTVTFNNTSVGRNLVSHQWDFGDGTVSNELSPVHTYTAAGSFTVKLVVTNASGCSDTLVRPNLINAANLQASFTNVGAICAGQQVSFKNTSTQLSTLDSTIWIINGSLRFKTTDLTYRFAAAGNYSIVQTVYARACVATNTQNITVIPGETTDFEVKNGESCTPPLNVSFRQTNSAVTVLFWDFGDGKTSSDPSPSHTYDGFGNFTVKMAYRNGSGCIDTITKPGAVKVNPPNITGIKGLPYNGCGPFKANLEAVVTAPEAITGYAWDFGDGTSSTDAIPYKEYATTGDYYVKLKITTSSGCTDTVSYKVKINDKPTAAFTGGPPLVCPTDTVNFQNQSTGNITKQKWFFGDGGTSTLEEPTYLYNDTGWMNVKLVVYNNGCADSITRQKYIYVNPPIARFKDSFNCADQSTHFFVNQHIGATRWWWYFDKTDSTQDLHTIRTFKDTGRHEVRLWVTDEKCYHNAIQTVYVLNEKADFEPDNNDSCHSRTIRFVARGPNTHDGNISKYEWTFEGEETVESDTNFIERTYEFEQPVTLKLKITDLNGCTDSITKTVDVKFETARADFLKSFQTICVGSNASFTDNSTVSAENPVVKWTWNFGDGAADSSLTKPPFNHVYKKPGYYDVRLIITDSRGCIDSVIKQSAVYVRETIADFISEDTLVCLNTPVAFINQSQSATGEALTYKWKFSGNKVSTDESPIIQFPGLGKYDAQLIASDDAGCADTLNKQAFIVVADADAQFSMSDSFSTCPPLLVSFTNKSQSNIINHWDFGDDNISTLIDPAHTYTQPGIFTVKLKVFGKGGCSDSTTKKIEIQGPRGNFSYAPLGGCPPLEVKFKANAINTKYYTWDYSDGQSDVTTAATAQHVYTIPGSYVPRLILEDALGCKVPVPGPDTINVYPTDAVIAPLAVYDFCDTASISFIDSSTSADGIVKYEWKFGDGEISDAKNPVHHYKKPGRYVVELRVWSLSGCTKADTLNRPIIIASSPILSFNQPPPQCAPASVKFTGEWLNKDTSVNTYQWDFGNGTTSTSLSPDTVRYPAAGTYNISLSAVNNYGCKSSFVLPFVVNDTPVVKLSPATSMCRGGEVTLAATGAVTYNWTASPFLNCTTCAEVKAKPDSNTVFYVVGTDANGCKSRNNVKVNVYQKGSLSVGPADSLCAGESVRLLAKGFLTYQWSPSNYVDNAHTGNPLAKPPVTTTYTVVGSDPLNCFTDSAKITVTVFPIPQMDIVENIIQSEPGANIPIRTTWSSDITSWAWSPVIGLSCSTCPQPSVAVGKKEKYTAKVMNAGGCVASDFVTVQPTCIGEAVFIPNTFSPNADGNNDVFYPRGTGLNLVKRFQIFNRWGELMYERSNFQLNDPTAAWNGTYKGALLTPDVYVFILEGQCGNNATYNVKGNVTLLR